MIASLSCGESALISHRGAAALRRLEPFDRGTIELTLARGVRLKDRHWIIHRGLVLPRDHSRVRGIPVTSTARTLLDIASICSDETTEAALDSALRRKLVTIESMRRYVSEVGPRAGVPLLRALLDAREGIVIPHSRFETRLFRVLARARLPRPIPQFRIHDHAGLFVAQVDFAYPGARVAIETDSYRFHSDPADWERDLERRNRVTILDWRLLHIGWIKLARHPDEVVDMVRTALGQLSL